MAADPDPPGDGSDGVPVDPTDLDGVGEADLAALAADAWTEDGYRTTVKEHGSHVFVFAKRREDGEIRGEIVWVAGERGVGESHLDQLRALAEKTGADSVTCLTVGSGEVDRNAAASRDVSVVDGDDLRAKLGVDGDADPGSGGDAAVPDDPTADLGSPSDGLGDLPPPSDDGPTSDGDAGISSPGDDEVSPPGVDPSSAAVGPDGTGAADVASSGVEPTETGSTESGGGPASTGPSEGDEGGPNEGSVDPLATDSSGASAGVGRRLDAWDGTTTGEDADRPPFDGLWAAVTRGDAVESVADLPVWDGTAR
ncbi:MAG: hypothetical protein ABEJ26_01025 [Halosimplex sp.]